MRQNRLRAGARYLSIAAMCAITATACGSIASTGSSGAGSGSGSGAGAAAPAKAPKVSLDIKVTGHPGAKPVRWTLRCDPAGGTHPDPAAACRVLLRAKNPFAPLPGHIMCPMIRVGSKTATVTGTWFGKKVHSVLADGGCTLQRWAEFGQIFN
jgi:hypothetical protein